MFGGVRDGGAIVVMGPVVCARETPGPRSSVFAPRDTPDGGRERPPKDDPVSLGSVSKRPSETKTAAPAAVETTSVGGSPDVTTPGLLIMADARSVDVDPQEVAATAGIHKPEPPVVVGSVSGPWIHSPGERLLGEGGCPETG